jgi:hypothetical protein
MNEGGAHPRQRWRIKTSTRAREFYRLLAGINASYKHIHDFDELKVSRHLIQLGRKIKLHRRWFQSQKEIGEKLLTLAMGFREKIVSVGIKKVKRVFD